MDTLYLNKGNKAYGIKRRFFFFSIFLEYNFLLCIDLLFLLWLYIIPL